MISGKNTHKRYFVNKKNDLKWNFIKLFINI